MAGSFYNFSLFFYISYKNKQNISLVIHIKKGYDKIETKK